MQEKFYRLDTNRVNRIEASIAAGTKKAFRKSCSSRLDTLFITEQESALGTICYIEHSVVVQTNLKLSNVSDPNLN